MGESTCLLPFEREALRWLLRGDSPVLLALRRQVEEAVVTGREISPVGYYASLGVRDGAVPRVEPPNLKLTSLEMSCPECPVAGIGFALHLVEGVIDTLEAFTYADVMPNPTIVDVARCRFEYTEGRRGDLAALAGASVSVQ